MTADRFAQLVDVLRAEPDVSQPTRRGFGSGALTAAGRIFAMEVRGALVVKLPRQRVDALVEGGEGTRFDRGKGQPMKEWLALGPRSTLDWETLAREALTFARSQNGPAR